MRLVFLCILMIITEKYGDEGIRYQYIREWGNQDK